MSTAITLVVTTLPDQTSAESLAQNLLERRLAACANILPGVTSIYRWQDTVQKDQEYLLLIKTQAHRYDEVESAILQQHPYELPEIIAMPVERGLADYLDWVKTATQ